MFNVILSLLGGFTFALFCTSLVSFFVRKLSRILFVLIAFPLFLIFFYHGFELISRQLFISDIHSDGGEITLEISPMRIPSGSDTFTYCKQFTTSDGQPIKGITKLDEISYCGTYYLLPRRFGMGIPFIKHADGKTAYWSSATQIITK
jgi:hypothetical protein